MKWKYITWIPAALVMLMIFGFSAEDAAQSSDLSGGISHELVQAVNQVFDMDMTSEEEQQWTERMQHPLRKCAHFIEYFLLAVCLVFHFRVCGYSARRIIVLTVLTGGLYACGDEMHQAFVPGRGPGIGDVLLDTATVLSGAVIFQAICEKLGKGRLKKQQNKENRRRKDNSSE